MFPRPSGCHTDSWEGTPPQPLRELRLVALLGSVFVWKNRGRFGGWVLDVWQHHTMVRRHYTNSYVYNKFYEVHVFGSLVKQYISHILTRWVA